MTSMHKSNFQSVVTAPTSHQKLINN